MQKAIAAYNQGLQNQQPQVEMQNLYLHHMIRMLPERGSEREKWLLPFTFEEFMNFVAFLNKQYQMESEQKNQAKVVQMQNLEGQQQDGQGINWMELLKAIPMSASIQPGQSASVVDVQHGPGDIHQSPSVNIAGSTANNQFTFTLPVQNSQVLNVMLI